jgi:hypothetical protein
MDNRSGRPGPADLRSDMSEYFPYHYDFRFAPMWLSAGVLPWRDGVTITDDDRLVATFGVFRVDTPLHNIADAHVTEGYRWWTAIGARLSFADDGLTFGTNHRAGTCIHFHSKIRRVLGVRDHSALTVTVADPAGLASTLIGRIRAPR